MLDAINKALRGIFGDVGPDLDEPQRLELDLVADFEDEPTLVFKRTADGAVVQVNRWIEPGLPAVSPELVNSLRRGL